MKDTIASSRSRIDSLYKEIRALEQFISAAQKICLHSYEAAPDLFDYHRREDYSRCSICGHIV